LFVYNLRGYKEQQEMPEQSFTTNKFLQFEED